MKGGNMNDINKIYQDYSKVVYKYILALSKSEDIAEEIVQETFLVAIQQIDKFKKQCKISTWLCQIAKFLWYKRINQKTKHTHINLDDIQNIASIDTDIEEKIILKEENNILINQIIKLDKNTQKVMYLRILGDLEYKEIAQILGKTSSWCRTTFFRGKEKIKEEKYE